MAFNRAQKRYTRTVLVLMTGYVVILLGVVSYATRHYPLSGPLGFVLGALPALPIVGVFGAMGRYLVDEQDEYVRALFARQALIATGITLGICTIWGFLENFGLVPHIYAYYAAILWFGSQGLASAWRCLARLFSRGEGE